MDNTSLPCGPMADLTTPQTLAAFMRRAGIGMMSWCPQDDSAAYSEQWAAIAGWDAASLPTSLANWDKTVFDADRPRVQLARHSVLSGAQAQYEVAYRSLSADSTPRAVLEKGWVSQRDETDTITRMEAMLEDLSAVQAPSSLQTADEYRELMLDASSFMSLIFDDEIQPVDCNMATVNYFGFTSKRALLEGLMPLLTQSIPAFQPDASPTIPLSTRFDYVIKNGALEFEIELVLRGERVPLRFSMIKLPYRGRFVIVCTMLDTLALKEARNELLRQDYLMRQVNRAATRLMSATPEQFDSVTSRTLKSLAQAVNACRLSIWQNHETDGETHCRELYTWDSDGRAASDQIEQIDQNVPYANLPEWYALLSANKRVNLTGRAMNYENCGRLVARGSKAALLIPVFLEKSFWGLITLSKNSDDNPFTATEEKAIQSSGIIAVAAIVRNQINQSLILAREQAMAGGQAKTDFLSRMSHEIRTPINAICGMTAIARKTQDLPRIQYSLEKIEVASQQLLGLINDILDMSKIESGKLEVSPIAFDFSRTMSNVLDVLQVRVEEKHQSLNFVCESRFDRQIITDELRLSQLMINIITNAVKFSPEGGEINVRASHHISDACTNMLRVAVQDHGIGISDAQQARLFRSFEQADGSITRRFGGTGLGLAICKSISQLLGGDIWVESVPDEGSTFTFEIQFEWGEPLTLNAPVEADAEPDYFWPGRRVLLAEDIEINREIILALLEDTGLEITCAENGVQAVEQVADHPGAFDLVLMDIQMPELDGIGATRLIRELPDPRAKTLPIIAMTANAFQDDVQRCLEAGMDGHIAKPVDIGMLYRAIAGAITR